MRQLKPRWRNPGEYASSNQGDVILENAPAQAKVAYSWRIRQLKQRWRNPGEYASSSQGGVILENTTAQTKVA